MKKTAIALIAVSLMAFGYQSAKKTSTTLLAGIALKNAAMSGRSLTVTASEKEWDYHFRNFNTIQQIVDGSDLPHQQVKFINNSIDSLKQLAFPQLLRQIADTTKKK